MRLQKHLDPPHPRTRAELYMAPKGSPNFGLEPHSRQVVYSLWIRRTKTDMCIARNRRIAALQNINADRILVEPVTDIDELRLPDENSMAAYIIDALGEGLTLDELAEETEWSKSRIMINIYQIAKKTGVGIQRRGQRLHLALPASVSDLLPENVAPAIS